MPENLADVQSDTDAKLLVARLQRLGALYRHCVVKRVGRRFEDRHDPVTGPFDEVSGRGPCGVTKKLVMVPEQPLRMKTRLCPTSGPESEPFGTDRRQHGTELVAESSVLLLLLLL